MKRIILESNKVPSDFTGINLYFNGEMYWYKSGRLHREGGPAVTWKDDVEEWWLNGNNYTKNMYSL